MAVNTWSSAGSTNMNLVGNWSLGALAATDDLTWNATSVINSTASANINCNSIIVTAAYSGNWSISGRTATCAAGITIDGTGTYTLGNGLTANGAASTVHFGAGVGATTATVCTLTLNGAGGMTLDDDKGLVCLALVLGANAVVATTGAAVLTYFQGNAVNLTMGANSTFTNNGTGLVFYRTTNGPFYSIGAGCTINGNRAITFGLGAAGLTCTAPVFTYTGTSIISLSDSGGAANSTITLTGAFNVGTARLDIFGNTNGFIFNSGGFGITAGQLNPGANAGSSTINFGASTINTTNMSNVRNGAAGAAINWQTSTINCSGNFTIGTNHTITPGTSVVNITGTSTITSAGESFYDLAFAPGAANTVTLAGALTTAGGGDLTITNGTLNCGGFAVSVGENFAVNGTSTCTATGSAFTFDGNVTFAAGCTLTINAATTFTFNGTGDVLSTGGKTMPQCTFNVDTYISDTCTITRVIYGIDGTILYFEAGMTFTITNLLAANFNGALGSLNGLRSSGTGTAFTLVLPNAVTLEYMDVRDCTALGFVATADDGTSVTQGGNTGWDFGFVLNTAAYAGGVITTTMDAAGVNQYPVSEIGYRLTGGGAFTPAVITAWNDDTATGTAALLPGTYDVQVISSDGALSAVLVGAFVVAAGTAGTSKISNAIGCGIGM